MSGLIQRCVIFSLLRGWAPVNQFDISLSADCPSVTIGRGEGVAHCPSGAWVQSDGQMLLDAPSCSRRHATISIVRVPDAEAEKGTTGRTKGKRGKKRLRAEECEAAPSYDVVFVDCDSSNGTFVNFRRIPSDSATRLHDGDTVIFGGSRDVEVGDMLSDEALLSHRIVVWRVRIAMTREPCDTAATPGTPAVGNCRETAPPGNVGDLHMTEKDMCEFLLLRSSRGSLERMVGEGVISPEVLTDVVKTQQRLSRSAAAEVSTEVAIRTAAPELLSGEVAVDGSHDVRLDFTNSNSPQRMVEDATRREQLVNSTMQRATSPLLIPADTHVHIPEAHINGRRSATNNDMSPGDKHGVPSVQRRSASAVPPALQVVPTAIPFSAVRVGCVTFRPSIVDPVALSAMQSRLRKRALDGGTPRHSGWEVRFSDTHIIWSMMDIGVLLKQQGAVEAKPNTFSVPVTSIGWVGYFHPGSDGTASKGSDDNTALLAFQLKQQCRIPLLTAAVFDRADACGSQAPQWFSFEVDTTAVDIRLWVKFFDAFYGHQHRIPHSVAMRDRECVALKPQ